MEKLIIEIEHSATTGMVDFQDDSDEQIQVDE